jgi:periplasmic protein TonB
MIDINLLKFKVMISYKTPQADLESKRGLYFEVGVVLSLLFVLFILQFKTPVKEHSISFNLNEMNLIEEEILNTEQPVAPPPPAEKPQQFSLLTVVEDESEEATDVDIQAEIDQSTAIPVYVPAEKPVLREEEEIVEKEIFTIVEKQPSFPGGESARLVYFAENLKYPTLARELGIMGVVYVGFVVEPDGSITNVKVLRGIGGGCDEEAVSVVSGMPKWNPGMQRNKAVRVQFTLPVRFALL